MAREHSERIKQADLGSPALGATNAVHAAAATSSGGATTINSGITNPDVPRNITLTAAGTAADVKAVVAVVTGTNADDEVITENMPAFTVDTLGTVTGSKAFKTVTSVVIPAMDGNGVTVAVGVGAKLGLTAELKRNSVVAAFLGNVKEASTTVVTDDDELEKNTITLGSALNGSAVHVDYYDTH